MYFQILGELPDDDITRKELEAAIGRLKPSHITPPPTASQSGVPSASSATPKKNLLGRVKSNRYGYMACLFYVKWRVDAEHLFVVKVNPQIGLEILEKKMHVTSLMFTDFVY